MKTTVAFSVLAVLSLAAIPATAVAECAGHNQSKVVRSSVPTPAASASATETAASQAAPTETPTSAPVPDNLVADLIQSDQSQAPKAE